MTIANDDAMMRRPHALAHEVEGRCLRGCAVQFHGTYARGEHTNPPKPVMCWWVACASSFTVARCALAARLSKANSAERSIVFCIFLGFECKDSTKN